MNKVLRAFVTLSIGVMLVLFPSQVNATRVDPSTQARINAIIEEFGGTQSSWNEVSWENGEVILAVASSADGAAAPMAVGSCAEGRYCAFSQAGYIGDKLSFTACPANQFSFAPLSNVRSVANSRATLTVRIYGGTVLKATLPPNTGTPNVSGVTRISCS